ncbi:MAG: DEAD/DEAH box helicase family protein [Acidimicrobiales bacterium]
MFDPDTTRPWARAAQAWLHEHLGDSELRAARRSILNAHYTSPDLAQHLWALAAATGWDGGKVLEPGCGIGIFAATAPPEARVTGIELDPITAGLATRLHHPAHEIRHADLADLDPTRESFSLVIGNVPFADVAIHDTVYNPNRNLGLHNWVIVKALAALDPGAHAILITSMYTLDATDPGARLEIARYGHFAGSVRLPSTAFQAHSGTSVTTDVVVFRRRPEVLTVAEAREATRGEAWIDTHQLDTGNGETVTVNRTYTATTQPNIVGTIVNGGMYRRDAAQVEIDPTHYRDRLDEAFTNLAAAISAPVSGPVTGTRSAVRGQARPERAPVDAVVAPPMPRWVKPGGLFGSRSVGFWQRPLWGETAERFEPSPKSEARVLEAWIGLRDAYLTLIDTESRTTSSDGDLDTLRAALNQRYDHLTGLLGHPVNHYTVTTTRDGRIRRSYPKIGGARANDPDYFAVLGLERYDPDTATATKAAIFTQRQIRPQEPVTRCDGVEDALAVSLAETGTVRIERISQLLDLDRTATVAQLAGHAFEDPDTGHWIPAVVYLSGDVRTKRDTATARAATEPRFAANIAALDTVVPTDVSPEDISVQLGVPWLTPDEVLQFLRDTLDTPLRQCSIAFHPEIGWKMQFPQHLEYGETITGTYGTPAMSALRITATALEGRPVRVYQTIDRDGREVRVLDRAATIEANAKLDDLNNALTEWTRQDPLRASELTERYNRLFRSHAAPTYPPAWRRPPTLAAGIDLRPHQNSAVFRAVMNPSVGLFHAVGAGKTITMASIAMELRRIGLARKPLIVVPNHLVEQITADFHRAHPGANVLLPDDRSVKGRTNLVSRIAAGDWDAVIFSYELFKAIPVSTETEIDYLNQRSDELRRALAAVAQATDTTETRRKTPKSIEKLIARFEEKIKELRTKPRDPTLTFEALGVDALLADEAHYAKNLVVGGTNNETVGQPSQRAIDLDLKIQLLRRITNGQSRIVLSTGTPISNSFAELWVMMRYLQPEILTQAGIGRFDEFVAQFARTVNELELQPTGQFRLTSRLSQFRNVPDLQLLFRQTADVRMADDLDLARPHLADGARQTVLVPANPQLDAYVQTLAQRAERLTYRSTDGNHDNMLAIYSDGRAAALSLQLVGHPDPTPSKLDLAARQIHQTWLATRHRNYLDPATGQPHPRPGALQIVFMDQGVPGSSAEHKINLYQQLRQRLVQLGIPPDSIAFVHDSKEPEKLYEQCREGRYAVLIGSTSKMGTGMNVQTRAVSLIHMDPTWRPADMEQREGRILRQGNQNPEVTIYNMLAEGSTDALMYQGLERKARMITQVLTGTNTARTVSDVDTALVQFGDMKALATGNPLVVEHLDLKRQVDELEIRARAWHRRTSRLQASRPAWQHRISQLEPALANLRRLANDSLNPTHWPIVCLDQPADTPAHADRILRSAAHAIPSTDLRPSNREPIEPRIIGAIGPWSVAAIRDWGTVTFTINVIDYDLQFHLPLAVDDLARDSDTRIWQRIANRPLRGIEAALQAHQDELRRLRSDLNQADHDISTPFPHQDQLDELRARLADVEDRLLPTNEPDPTQTEPPAPTAAIDPRQL